MLTVGVEHALGGIAGFSNSITVSDLNKLIAEELTYHAHGLEGDILRKSIQETLFYSMGTEQDVTQMEFEKRLKQFLRRRGLAGFVQLFLSLHVFNVVWFDTSEMFPDTADSNNSFVHKMQSVKRGCRKIAKGTRHPLTTSSAEKLIAEISARLQELGY